MDKTQRYEFTVDEAENFCVLLKGTDWGQYARSKDAVLRNAEAMAVGMFGHQFFCGVDEVRILESVYDEGAGTCHVTVEGPVGPEFERQVLIPEPLWSVMAACETNCVSSCCGLDAFDIDAEHIRLWAAEEEGRAGALAEALRQIEELVKALSTLSGEYFTRELSFDGDSQEWAAMLGRWRDAITQAQDKPQAGQPRA